MFTGIIRHVGIVRTLSPSAGGKRLAIDLGPLAEGLRTGDSIAVSGACLTVAAISGAAGQFDVIAETLSRTTLGALKPAARVNLEPALRPSEGLDGHIVQGHVDGLAQVSAVRRGGRHELEFSAGRELTDLMVAKGSVAIDGVSLTLVDVSESRFSVALIPTTLSQTTLGELSIGSRVNIETDILGRYVMKFLRASSASGGLTLAKLKQAGFE